jgi:flagellar basal body rod protein FlgC
MSLLLTVFQVSSSAMTAQSMRLNAVASNLANADSVIDSADGKPYRAKQVVFEATPMGNNGDLSKGVRVRRSSIAQRRRAWCTTRKIRRPTRRVMSPSPMSMWSRK